MKLKKESLPQQKKFNSKAKDQNTLVDDETKTKTAEEL